MKQYLIRIENGHTSEFTTIYGDSRRPFMIARNLWNYTTPGHAAQRLEKIAKSWENNGHTVKRVFGTVADMPTRGDEFNIEMTLIDFGASRKTYRELIKEHYHY
jgi:hypothetical protein